MKKKVYYIFDFDSTFISVEAIDELAKLSLKKNPDSAKILREIEKLTNDGMEGKISFPDSLAFRLDLMQPSREDVGLLVKKLSKKVSRSVARNKNFFKNNADNIYIISGCFKEIVAPVVSNYNVPEQNIFANTFTYGKSGEITGFDRNNLLAKRDGKIKVLKKLELEGELHVIGDGYTDYQLKQAGIAHKFFAFTENIEREIAAKADHITPSLDEFLYLNKLPMSISYPKNRIKVLLLEKVHPDAVKAFKEEGYSVETVNNALNEKELAEAIKDVSILGIRSKTCVTEKVLKNANRLLAIGAFCIGTNQIDLNAALRKGVAVFNAPYSNTRSVVELAIGEIIMLMRGIADKSVSLHKGKWNKSAAGSYEVRGKSLGIVGYGNIGSQLSVIAEALGMEVNYYDVVEKLALGNAKRCLTLNELLKKSDIISLHIDDRKDNLNYISSKEFAKMKKGVIFINLSRGFVVDIDALRENILNGKIAGAAIDVFPEEPAGNNDKFKSPLCGLPNVILTPHIGGSTEEAQKNIGGFVSSKLMDYINKGNSNFSVNFPNLQLPELKKAHRLMHIHANMPGILAEINNLFAKRNINILGQYLKTNETIGYVITDVEKNYPPELIQELKNITHTIRFRVLY